MNTKVSCNYCGRDGEFQVSIASNGTIYLNTNGWFVLVEYEKDYDGDVTITTGDDSFCSWECYQKRHAQREQQEKERREAEAKSIAVDVTLRNAIRDRGERELMKEFGNDLRKAVMEGRLK